MFTIIVNGEESFNQETGEFVYPESFELQLEHSLVSLSKWESKFEKPFLGPEQKTNEELLGYIEAMILTPNPPPDFLQNLSEKNFKEIQERIDAKMTATWFSDMKKPSRNAEVITNELIYYWLSSYNIDIKTVEHWHLSRLFTLLKVHQLKNEKPKKMSRADIHQQQRELNAKRLAEMGTSG